MSDKKSEQLPLPDDLSENELREIRSALVSWELALMDSRDRQRLGNPGRSAKAEERRKVVSKLLDRMGVEPMAPGWSPDP